MAKTLGFPTRAKKAARTVRRPFSAGTFIQRSRGESSEQKAMWHHVQGAGKSRVKREFFGLTDQEAALCRERLAAGLAQRVEAFGK